MDIPYQAQQTVSDYGLLFSGRKFSAALAADISTAFTVPGSQPRYKAVIQIDSVTPGWMALGATAEVPTGAFAPTQSEMIQAGHVYCREVKAGDVIEFLHPAVGANVSIALYTY